MRKQLGLIAVTLCLLLVATSASAESLSGGNSSSRSKWGFDLEALRVSTHGYGGLALGFRSVSYLGSSGFNWGYELHVGASDGVTSLSNNNHLYVGGMTFGSDGILTGSMIYELNFLFGYADGNMASQGLRGDSLVMKPSAGIGFLLGYGWRGTLSVGYMFLPSANGFNGMTVGIRLDRKVFTSSRPADN